jgi:hypothetical protein
MLAYDADTFEVVAEQIAGALGGGRQIPAHWLDRNPWRAKIERMDHQSSDAHAYSWP